MPRACGCIQNTNSEQLSRNSVSQIKLLLTEPAQYMFWDDTGKGSHLPINGLDKCPRPFKLILHGQLVAWENGFGMWWWEPLPGLALPILQLGGHANMLLIRTDAWSRPVSCHFVADEMVDLFKNSKEIVLVLYILLVPYISKTMLKQHISKKSDPSNLFRRTFT